MRILILGGTKFLGRAIAEAALGARARADAVQPRPRRTRSCSRRPSSCAATANGDLSALEGRTLGRGDRHVRLRAADVRASAELLRETRPLRLRLERLRLRRLLQPARPRRARSPSSVEDAGRRDRRPTTRTTAPLKALCEAEVERRVRRARADRPAGSDRGTARPDRPLHVLGAAASRAAARCSRPGRPSGTRSSSTSAISRAGSSTRVEARALGDLQRDQRGRPVGRAAGRRGGDVGLGRVPAASTRSGSGWSCRSGSPTRG